MGLRLRYDRDRCAGSASCVYLEPEVFDQDEDGRVVVLSERPDERFLQHVRDAVALCPAQALSLESVE